MIFNGVLSEIVFYLGHPNNKSCLPISPDWPSAFKTISLNTEQLHSDFSRIIQNCSSTQELNTFHDLAIQLGLFNVQQIYFREFLKKKND